VIDLFDKRGYGKKVQKVEGGKGRVRRGGERSKGGKD